MNAGLTITQILELFSAADMRGLKRLVREHGDDPRAGVRAACAAAEAKLAASRAEANRTKRLYATERELYEQGCQAVAGVDEVGRGALAGPLTVAAVILPSEPRIEGLDDSKRLAPARREELSALIHEVALSISIVHISAGDVDSMGLTMALKTGVVSALAKLAVPADRMLLDGLPLRVCDYETAIVRGDSKVAAIAAASIVAKVARDDIMRQLATEFPGYSFELNKGYGTSEHLEALNGLGPCEIHRRSFSPGGGTISLF